MGGLGSGKRGHRPVAEELKQIDVRKMKRDNMFVAETWANEVWEDGFRVFIQAGVESFTLSFGDVTQEVELTFRPVHFGGFRVFCLCPVCYGQCAILYFYNNRFCCKDCCNVTWQSSNNWVHERNVKKKRKLRAKMGSSSDILDPIDGKPFNMHWSTYYKLLVQHNNVGETISPHLLKEMKALEIKDRLT